MPSIEELQPLPDEHLASIVARFHRRNARSSVRFTLDELLSDPDDARKFKKRSLHNFFVNSGVLNIADQAAYLNRTTLLPLQRIWRSVEDEIKSIHDRLYPWNDPLTWDIQDESCWDVPQRFFNFCPHCVHEDLSTHGVSYWHRIHQVPGVAVCPQHRSPLRFARHPTQDVQPKPNRRLPNTPLHLPSDVAFEPRQAICLVDPAELEQRADIANNHASICELLLNLPADIAFQADAHLLILDALSQTPFGTPKAVEGGGFLHAFKSYHETMSKLVVPIYLEPYTAYSVNMTLYHIDLMNVRLPLVSFLFKSTEQLHAAIRHKELKRHHLRPDEPGLKEKLAKWTSEGIETTQIARWLSVSPLEAWAYIRSIGLVPVEVETQLTSVLFERIEALLCEHYEFYMIARALVLPERDLKAMVARSEQLFGTYSASRRTGLMRRKKLRIKNLVRAEWPCDFERIRTKAPEICEWVGKRDPDWLSNLERNMKLRNAAIQPRFLLDIPLESPRIEPANRGKTKSATTKAISDAQLS